MHELLNTWLRYSPHDPCGTLFLAALVACVGHVLVADRKQARRLGVFAGGVVFVVFVFIGIRRGEEPFAAAATAGCVGGFVLGLCWLLLAGVAAVGERWHALCASWQQHAAARHERDQELRRQQQARKSSSPTQPSAPAAGPDVLRAQAEAQARLQAEGETKRRKSEARASCLHFYLLHPELGGPYPRPLLDEHLAQIDAQLTSEKAEAWAAALLDELRRRLARVVPPAATQSLAEILATFDARLAQLDASSLPSEDKETLRIHIEQQRVEILKRAISEGRL